jgi:Fe2+ or Zn2+ uptake regulation protein
MTTWNQAESHTIAVMGDCDTVEEAISLATNAIRKNEGYTIKSISIELKGEGNYPTKIIMYAAQHKVK